MWPFKKKQEPKPDPAREQVQAFAAAFEAEEFDLVAVTGPEVLGTKKQEGDTLYTIAMPLTAWMDEDDGVVHEEPALLTALADERLIGYLRARLPGNFIIKVRVRPARDGGKFQLVGMPEPGMDPELKAILKRQLAPVTFEAEGLGTFTLNRAMNWFETHVNWLGVNVLLAFDQSEDRQDCLATARAMLADPEQWDNRLRDFVVQRLLACVNEQAQTPVCREEMLESMTAETLVACPQGEFAFWYGGAPIFEAVRITGTLDAGPAEAEMDE